MKKTTSEEIPDFTKTGMQRMFQIEAIEAAEKQKPVRKKKVEKAVCPNPFTFCVYGSPCRQGDLFTPWIRDIFLRWRDSPLYELSKRSRYIAPQTYFREFVASELSAETVPALTSGKIGLLYEEITQLTQKYEEEKLMGNPSGENPARVQRHKANGNNKQPAARNRKTALRDKGAGKKKGGAK